MKKNYCDYCGEECSPTPEFKVPDIGINEVRAINKKNGTCVFAFEPKSIRCKKVDVCYECQKKMVALLKLLPNVEVNSSGILELGDRYE